ncbi:geranylgeranyl pyrophosphate synthase [Rhodoplanes roseus]|uniref:Probable farnesyl diphosphate synthase n=1 Tax=Rhodoplanes roseus TaxID=29409 RepID=A0A327L6Y5_9BRAD|nr:geranylgeranyl pyrophosphate synthase [Rhodoplanes roseus]
MGKTKHADVAKADAGFPERLDAVAADTEALLDRLLDAEAVPGERIRPARVLEAMRYASLGGGKRFRPFLAVESALLFGGDRERALMVGAAVEFVHCYSLVHDDLPSMDNDDLRRGRPTTHKAFDEATAILAGDALLTFAFDVLGRPETHPDAAVRIDLVLALARASGLGGMVGGQMLDLAAEGRFAAGTPQPLDRDATEVMESMKTGALLRFSCVGGAIVAGADRDAQAALDRYGTAIGKAFQVADDLLDAEGDPATVGKATKKDAGLHKATLVRIMGIDGARRALADLVAEAEDAIASFGAHADILRAAARFVAERSH